MRIFRNILVVILLFLITVLMQQTLTGCQKKDVVVDTFSGDAKEAGSDNSGDTLVTEAVAKKNDYSDNTEDRIISTDADTSLNATGREVSDKVDSNKKLCVYVCGAVINEGVYYFEDGAICDDALKAAGGYSEDAVRGYVNLAKPLVDSEKIYFPRDGEALALTDSSESSNTNISNASDKERKEGSLVNINTATREELKTLPGIGDTRADRIIEYRNSHGSFTSTEEIMKIDGIKDKLYNDIKDLITI